MFVNSGNEHSMCITTSMKLMVSGNSKNNKFCDKDENNKDIYDIKQFKMIGKELLQMANLVKVCCGDFHTLALTEEG